MTVISLAFRGTFTVLFTNLNLYNPLIHDSVQNDDFIYPVFIISLYIAEEIIPVSAQIIIVSAVVSPDVSKRSRTTAYSSDVNREESITSDSYTNFDLDSNDDLPSRFTISEQN